MRSRSDRSACGSSAPGRERRDDDRAARHAGLRAVGREARSFRVTPRFRGRELGLLLLVGIALFVGSVSLGATERFRDALLDGGTERSTCRRRPMPGSS